MLNIMKKSFAILLVIAMVVSLGACGKNGDKGGTSSNGNNGGTSSTGKPVDPEDTLDTGNSEVVGSVNTETIVLDSYDIDSAALIAKMPKELKKTKIKFLNWYDPMQREEKVVIEEFEKKTGIDVEIIVKQYGPEYNGSLAQLVATGDSPDVLRMLAPRPSHIRYLQPMSVTGFDFSSKAWDKEAEAAYSVNGKAYATNLRYSPFFLPAVMFYNTKTMEEYEFEDPYELFKKGEWTWDKLVEICGEWVKSNPDFEGLSMLPKGDLPAMSAGIDWCKYDGKQYSVDLTDANMLEKWQFTLENKKAKIFTEDQSKFDNSNQTTLFAVMDATALQSSSEYYRKTRKRGNLKCVPIPSWGKDKTYYVPLIENLAFGIPVDAKNPKAVPYFLAYYLDFSNYDTEGTKFFYSEQAREVYINLMKMTNRSFNNSQFLLNAEGGYHNVNIYRNVDPAQLTIWLQEREYIINDTVALLNADLAQVQK